MTVLVTGGAGFIGTNVAHALLAAGEPVRILDDLSRIGVERNVRWLESQHGARLELVIADVRDPSAVARALTGVQHVFHFAAQVAVTTSIDHPRLDFDINAGGTLNLLEAIRTCPQPPSLVYTSTNKVYGALDDVATHLAPSDDVETRRLLLDVTVRRNGREPVLHRLTSRERALHPVPPTAGGGP